MRSLDLFTGIAGMTYALHPLGIVPHMYCETDPAARTRLERLMTTNRIPTAPIHDDVRTLHLHTGTVDLIIGGFPCQGFSHAGKREGLDHPGSGLVSEVFRLVASTKAPFVFLENVTALLHSKNRTDLEHIVATFDSMGYDGRYVVMHGYDVGCPQKRSRAYFLFTKRRCRGAKERTLQARSSSLVEPKVPEPPRFTNTRTPHITTRVRLLGNSVIPEMTRLAFLFLWTGCTMSRHDLMTRIVVSVRALLWPPWLPPQHRQQACL
jgi:DNA-cytosine methyltransferase